MLQRWIQITNHLFLNINPEVDSSLYFFFINAITLTMRQALIVRKNTLTDEEETRQRLAKMEKSLLLLAEQQNHILSVLNGISKWKLSSKGVPNDIVTTHWSTWCGVFFKVRYIFNNCSWSWIACSPFNHQINLIHRSFCFFDEKYANLFLTANFKDYILHETLNREQFLRIVWWVFDLVYICQKESML